MVSCQPGLHKALDSNLLPKTKQNKTQKEQTKTKPNLFWKRCIVPSAYASFHDRSIINVAKVGMVDTQFLAALGRWSQEDQRFKVIFTT